MTPQSEVKKYMLSGCAEDDIGYDSMYEHNNGDWVRSEDYDKLKEKYNTLHSYVENVLLKTNKSTIVRIKNEMNTFYKECFDNRIEEIKSLKEEVKRWKGHFNVMDATVKNLKEENQKLKAAKEGGE